MSTNTIIIGAIVAVGAYFFLKSPAAAGERASGAEAPRSNSESPTSGSPWLAAASGFLASLASASGRGSSR